jgi:hypothetical protein
MPETNQEVVQALKQALIASHWILSEDDDTDSIESPDGLVKIRFYDAAITVEDCLTGQRHRLVSGR